MTRAVCWNCGTSKWGALNDCESCGADPTERGSMESLALSDHYFSGHQLDLLSRKLKAGELDFAALLKEVDTVRLPGPLPWWRRGETSRSLGIVMLSWCISTQKKRNRKARILLDRLEAGQGDEFILLLAPFHDDSNDEVNRIRNVEIMLAYFSPVPVLRLSPTLSRYGAGYVETRDEDWKSVVGKLAAHARMIFAIDPMKFNVRNLSELKNPQEEQIRFRGTGLAAEMDLLISGEYSHKVAFLLNGGAFDPAAPLWNYAYKALSADEGLKRPNTPEVDSWFGLDLLKATKNPNGQWRVPINARHHCRSSRGNVAEILFPGVGLRPLSKSSVHEIYRRSDPIGELGYPVQRVTLAMVRLYERQRKEVTGVEGEKTYQTFIESFLNDVGELAWGGFGILEWVTVMRDNFTMLLDAAVFRWRSGRSKVRSA